MTPAPQWFRERIVDGLTLLLSFGLPGSPTAEVAPLTTTGWIEVLWRKPIDWSEALDADRLQAAFLSLAGATERWPAPVQLLAHMAPRADASVAALPAPAPRLSAKQRAELSAMRRRLSDHLCATHGKPRGWGVGVAIGDGTFNGAGMTNPGEQPQSQRPESLGQIHD